MVLTLAICAPMAASSAWADVRHRHSALLAEESDPGTTKASVRVLPPRGDSPPQGGDNAPPSQRPARPADPSTLPFTGVDSTSLTIAVCAAIAAILEGALLIVLSRRGRAKRA